MVNVMEILEAIASWFRGMGIPQPIVHWGHPVMMGTVIFAMGSAVGWAGWRGRLAKGKDEDAVVKNLSKHRQIAPWMFLFLAMGYTGGILSLVMQEQDLFASPHFWTGSLVLVLLLVNGIISLTKFGGNQAVLRTVHAYLGSAALSLMVIHAVLGVKLGMSF
jgi:hypothetical protein